MKLTKSLLKTLIKEEITKVLTERKDFAAAVSDATGGLRKVAGGPMQQPAGIAPELQLQDGEFGIRKGWIIYKDGADLKTISPRQLKGWNTGDWDSIRAGLRAEGWTEVKESQRSLLTPEG
jgi:hypothetical protein